MAGNTSTRERREGYVRRVRDRQPGMDPWVAAAMADVPRDAFLDLLFEPSTDPGRGWTAINRRNLRHLELCYTVRAWPIRLGSNPPERSHTLPGTAHGIWNLENTNWPVWDRALSGPVHATPTAECPDPALLAAMLTALRVDPTSTVLQLPTGSGYPTGLLCHRVGADRVTTLDRDPDLVEQAHDALIGCGLQASMAIGKMTAGWRKRALYDRILATCSVRTIPPAWIGQVRPGGNIVAGIGWGASPTPVVALTVTDDGGAHGRLLRHHATLVSMPGTSTPRATLVDEILWRDPRENPVAATSVLCTDLNDAVLTNTDFRMFASLAAPQLRMIRHVAEPGCYWYTTMDGCVAIVCPADGMIYEYGPRRLGGRLEAVHQAWRDADSPTAERIGLNIAPSGRQSYWLDHPNKPLWTEKPSQ